MPFTLSHAGFVLPLRRWLSGRVLFALMIGCVVPDFGYFIREFGVASYAHTVVGAISVSVPIGFVFYLASVLCFRRVAAVLPEPHCGFLATWDIHRKAPRVSFIAVLMAILLGALSHNFVDSFTHESGLAVSLFPALAAEAFSISGEPLHVYRVLQYSGSVLGMGMIVATYYFALRSHCLTERVGMWQAPRRWLVLMAVSGLTILVAGFLNASFLAGGLDLSSIRTFAFKFLITWIPLFAVVFLCFALIFPRSPITAKRKQSNRRS